MEAEARVYNVILTSQGATPGLQRQPPQSDRGTHPQVHAHREITKELPFIEMGMHPATLTHLRFGSPKPPTISVKIRSGLATVNLGNTPSLANRFSPLGEMAASREKNTTKS
jgi:hypothetical protein